jgi:beta-glucosidase
VQIPLNVASLASFNTEKARWIADAGKYKIRIGASAEDIKLTKEFTLEKEVLLPQLHKVLMPQVEIAEMKP